MTEVKRITLLTNPDKCNKSCPLCFLQQRQRPFGMGEMPFEIAKNAIEKYGVLGNLKEVVPSTMGEPLLYSHFEDLLDLCMEKGVQVQLTTNGTFPEKWGTAGGLKKLLRSCSDIKISCMEFPNAFWMDNVECLLALRKELGAEDAATVSLQVTLHKKLLPQLQHILRWAENVGVWRIKWNKVVFLAVASAKLREEFQIDEKDLDTLRRLLCSSKVLCQGSLFFESSNSGKYCPFKNEIWVLPDGSLENCPNPERRFGNMMAKLAQCVHCGMG